METVKIYDRELLKKNLFLEREEIKKNLYLRKILTDEIQGPMPEQPSLNRKWLKYYTEEQIMTEIPKKSIYEYMIDGNKNSKNDIALYYFGKKISYKKMEIQINKCVSSLKANGIKKGDVG